MVNNINAQEYLNKKYPKKGVCKSNSDKENKDKKREQIIILDLSKGKVGKGRFNDGKILEGSLKIEGFANLQTLIISSQSITSLDVSNCCNLEKLDCSDNKITDLDVASCTNLKKINCSSNNIKSLKFSDCLNLEEVKLSGCQVLDKNSISLNKEANLIFNIEEDKLVKGPVIIPAGENILNILLIGKKYCLIDNIGFGDTSNLSEEDILKRVADGIYSAREGINQILFVVDRRFTEKHTKAFKKFERFISETGVTKFTTIVKTGFTSFGNPALCENDRRILVNENGELKKIIESCNNIIHVDNPSVAVEGDELDLNVKKRKESRKRVLNYLTENCSEIYKLREWDELYSVMVKYKEAEEKLVNAKSEKEKAEIEIIKKS
ncbi:19000_t:CDS:2 [Funneliformis geosporum]|uniref:19000_t:CDS:1 n=1 Tax=Funneliformis geosporum TaxID=1117311 RepID=A0A9W4WQK0_9GLOM|nr:19000_t:CDS:2 [Funneliformis geosporum]